GPRPSTYDVPVCTDDSPASVAAAVRHDVQPGFEIDLEPVDSVAVLTLMDNVTDNLMADHGPARRADPARSPWRPLAMMAEGRTPDGLIRAVGRLSLPVLIHPHFWRQRRLQLPGREPREIPTTSRGALVGAGFDIIEERLPSFLFGRSVLITGEIARTTGYEPGFPPQQACLDGRWQPDPLVLDEQALIVNVRDRGLVVITGCGHAGVVNIARYARRLPGAQPLYALLGGFHLGGPLFEPLIPQVLDELAALNPGVLVPAHCTGWRAQHAMSSRFPDAYVPSAVGTTFLL